MSEKDIDTRNRMQPPEGWRQMRSDARSSTVGYFKAGLKCVEPVGEARWGDEVLVWRGVSDIEGHVNIDNLRFHDDNPDEACFVIEFLRGGQLLAERLAPTPKQALAKAEKLAEEINSEGSYTPAQGPEYEPDEIYLWRTRTETPDGQTVIDFVILPCGGVGLAGDDDPNTETTIVSFNPQ